MHVLRSHNHNYDTYPFSPSDEPDAFINAITVAAIQRTSTSMVTNAGLHSCIVARKSDIARATHGDSISHHEF